MHKTKVITVDPDNIESLDQYINDCILSGDGSIPNPYVTSAAVGCGKTTLNLIMTYRLISRLLERKLAPLAYKSKRFEKMQASILEYTGDPIQQEAIKQMFPDRKFYFCYEQQTKKDFLFCPSYPVSISAYPGQYLVMTKGGGFSAITKKEFEEDWYPVESNE